MPNTLVPASAIALPYHRATILKAAHFTAKWRVANGGGSYRKWFAQALTHEWQKAKADRLRRESNVGLPRSRIADRSARRLFTRGTGRRAGLFAG